MDGIFAEVIFRTHPSGWSQSLTTIREEWCGSIETGDGNTTAITRRPHTTFFEAGAKFQMVFQVKTSINVHKAEEKNFRKCLLSEFWFRKHNCALCISKAHQDQLCERKLHIRHRLIKSKETNRGNIRSTGRYVYRSVCCFALFLIFLFSGRWCEWTEINMMMTSHYVQYVMRFVTFCIKLQNCKK